MRLCSFWTALLVANIALASPTEDLWKAIQDMDPEGVLTACTAGADMNEKNIEGCSPIYAAVMNYARMRQEHIGDANIEDLMERLNLVIQYMLAFGADPEGTNAHGFTAVGTARNVQLPLLIQMLEGALFHQDPSLPPEAPQLDIPAPGPDPGVPITAQLTSPVVIHAVAGPDLFLFGESRTPTPSSHLDRLFQEHNPPEQNKSDEDFDSISLQDSEEEFVGQPGRLPTMRERLQGNLRAFPLLGPLLAIFPSFSQGPSGSS